MLWNCVFVNFWRKIRLLGPHQKTEDEPSNRAGAAQQT